MTRHTESVRTQPVARPWCHGSREKWTGPRCGNGHATEKSRRTQNSLFVGQATFSRKQARRYSSCQQQTVLVRSANLRKTYGGQDSRKSQTSGSFQSSSRFSGGDRLFGQDAQAADGLLDRRKPLMGRLGEVLHHQGFFANNPNLVTRR